jgi:hypothetical protein
MIIITITITNSNSNSNYTPDPASTDIPTHPSPTTAPTFSAP